MVDTLMADEMTRPVEKRKKIPVVEMFGPTVQGEGMVIGDRTVFIRFGLCDYKCKMCDSMHAVDPQQVKANALWLYQEDIFNSVYTLLGKGGCKNVTFSGGNPCIHDLSLLVTLLKDAGITISVETQGTFCPDWLRKCDWVTVSPKGPGMGEVLELDKLDKFIEPLCFHTQLALKVVIFDARDLEVASMLVERYAPYMGKAFDMYLSLGNTRPPGMDEGFGVEDIAAMLVNHYEQLFEEIKGFPNLQTVKFIPQLHVLMYGNKKGV